jgi:O-antigen/teichoic acid export membrane protein
VFAVGKILLLFVLVTLLPAYGIFISWIVPAALALVPVTLLIRRRLVGELLAGAPPGPSSLVPSQVAQYAAADYAGSLFWLAATSLVPVLVTEVSGPTANAHFYLAWTIAYTLYLIAPSMGSSLIVEAVLDPARLESYSKRAFIQTARLVVPLAALLVLAAPYILGLLGSSYAAEGTPLIRLLALSAIPNIITALYTSIVRARRQVGAIVGILAAQCISVLALSYVLLPLAGITGVGLAWLISQTAIAGTLLVALRRSLRPVARPSDL